jgi:P4 family phage/plasmid primase-like protien
MPTKYESYIEKYRACKNSAFTHTTMNGGKYYVPGNDEKELLQLYCEHINTGSCLSLTENRRDQFPVLIDLDFRFPMDKTDRQYTIDTVKRIVQVYTFELCKYVGQGVNTNNIIIMEKEHPIVDDKKQVVKDGIHIMIPDIVTDKHVQLQVRKNCLNALNDILRPLGCINSIEDIVDEAVICKNNWMVYGSQKPGNIPYRVTHHWNVRLDEQPLLTFEDYVPMLSIRNKFTVTALVESKKDEIQQLIDAEPLDLVTKEPPIRPKQSSLDSSMTVDFNELELAVMLLDKKRSDNYESWRDVVWAIGGSCNCDEQGLHIAQKFSAQCPEKYDADSVETYYYKNGKLHEGLTMASIVFWLKADDTYDAFQKTRLKSSLDKYLYMEDKSTDVTIANVFYELHKDDFVCAGLDDKKRRWYRFNNHRWNECADVALHKRIDTTLIQFYRDKATHHSQLARSLNDEDEDEKAEVQQKLANGFKSIATKLGSKSKKNHIVAQLEVCFYKEKNEFYDLLDENPNLLGFTNGVYDFTISDFRDGRPNDMLTMSVGYEIPVLDTDVRAEIMAFYESLFDCKEVMQYKLTTNAYQLCGSKYLEIFWILTGTGRNGKSKESDLLCTTFGQYAYTPDITLFTTKKNDSSKANPELAAARGKRIMVSVEPDAKEKLISSNIKAWTGNDKIQARDLYVKNIEFYLQAGISILCNSIPKFTTFQEAEAARTKIINYPFSFVNDPNPNKPYEKQIDLHLESKVRDVRWAQQNMLILLEIYNERVRGRQAIPTPDKVNIVTKNFHSECDVVAQFIDQQLELVDDTKARIAKKDMYDEFMSYLTVEGKQSDQIPSKDFHTAMVAKGLEPRKNKGYFYYTGVRVQKCVDIASENEDDDEL